MLQEDLESEMTLRRRVEHEKQGLQMQVLTNQPYFVGVLLHYFSRSSLCLSVLLRPSLAPSLSWTSTGRGRQRWRS